MTQQTSEAHARDNAPPLDQGGFDQSRDSDRSASNLSELVAPLGDDPVQEDPIYAGAVGRTMFDTPGAEDGRIAAVIHFESLNDLPAQTLVRISSRHDSTVRSYVGTVVAGPFHHPDNLRADAPLVVTTSARGAMFMPPFHGYVEIEILGEEASDQRLVPPRYRPRPNSPVHVLAADDKDRILHAGGDLAVGSVFGDPDLAVGIPSASKNVLPRHTAVLGTTGAGKSTTVGNLVHQATAAGWSVVLIDTEGEYVELDRPTEDDTITAVLDQNGIAPDGIPDTSLLHLVGSDTANPGHPNIFTFSPSFSRISPYTVAEILNMNEAQQDRFFRTVDLAKDLLRVARVYPTNDQEEREALEINEFEEGYPHLDLALLMDLMRLTIDIVDKVITKQDQLDTWQPQTSWLRSDTMKKTAHQRIASAKPSSAASWKKTTGMLARLKRLRVFDSGTDLDIDVLLTPGRLSLVDLSDLDAPAVNNIVIADLLRRVQRAQDEAYRDYEAGRRDYPRKVLVVIEEAHEFISSERVRKMPHLLEQVTKIAKRGRKRWLGLMFVTQLPQHLPKEVLALTNNVVIHKISDETVLRTLRPAVPGIEDALWKRVPALAPGQAVVSFGHMRRPLLTTMLPARGKLRMVD